MNRRTFLSLSILSALYPTTNWADTSPYSAIGVTIPGSAVQSDDLAKLITNLEKKVKTITKQAQNSTVGVIAESHQKYLQGIGQTIRKINTIQNALDTEYNGVNLLLGLLGVVLAVTSALVATKVIIIGVPTGIALGTLVFGYSIIQLIRQNDKDALGSMITGRVGEYLSLLSLGEAPKAFLAVTNFLAKYMAILSAVVEPALYLKDLVQTSKFQMELARLKKNLKTMQKIDDYETYKNIYLKNSQETIRWLKEFHRLTKPTNGIIVPYAPAMGGLR